MSLTQRPAPFLHSQSDTASRRPARPAPPNPKKNPFKRAAHAQNRQKSVSCAPASASTSDCRAASSVGPGILPASGERGDATAGRKCDWERGVAGVCLAMGCSLLPASECMAINYEWLPDQGPERYVGDARRVSEEQWLELQKLQESPSPSSLDVQPLLPYEKPMGDEDEEGRRCFLYGTGTRQAKLLSEVRDFPSERMTGGISGMPLREDCRVLYEPYPVADTELLPEDEPMWKIQAFAAFPFVVLLDLCRKVAKAAGTDEGRSYNWATPYGVMLYLMSILYVVSWVRVGMMPTDVI